ncbi:uncharacterized protein BXIN_1957 [Babesia sp. Xinjiang]|uniref:uncharacterized protein n=1 Tax=Babesia sp. Xinjiang TaxID=462227 RepID=UPI000A2460EC|nr:uncharacterized protein BXIN_1957 [Babesia sp. Xinjiang]ORM40461.1 hypothetical protein BXIN_1957 [Babesia sp. Xinjiang]
MEERTEDSLVRDNNRQWTLSNRVEAEGLEWLYTDPSAGKQSANQLEEYLLGKSIEGARGELGRETIDQTAAGSLLADVSGGQAVDDTLSKFREDPLFVIKKIEMHQRQVLQKYESLAKINHKENASTPSKQSSESRKRPDEQIRRRSKEYRGRESHGGGRHSTRRSISHDRIKHGYHERHSPRNPTRIDRKRHHEYRDRRSFSSGEDYHYQRGYRDRRDRDISERGDCRRNQHSKRGREYIRASISHERLGYYNRHRYSRDSNDSAVGRDGIMARRRSHRRHHSNSSQRYAESYSSDRGSYGRRRRYHRRRVRRSPSGSSEDNANLRRGRHRRSLSHRTSRSISNSYVSKKNDRRARGSHGSRSIEADVPARVSDNLHKEPTAKRKLGPQVPRKCDPLKYAFGVTEDIMPPQAIQDRAEQRRREMEERKKLQQSLFAPSDTQDRLEEMQSHGEVHLKERLQQMEEHERRVQTDEVEDSRTGKDYISAVKQHAFESVKMAERIRQRAPKTLVEDQ